MITAFRKRDSQYAHLSFDATKWMVSVGCLIAYGVLRLIMSVNGFTVVISFFASDCY